MGGVLWYAADSGEYDEVDSSARRGGLTELEKLTEHLESQVFVLNAWDFSAVDTALEELGRNDRMMAHADEEIGSIFDLAETFLVGLVDAPDLTSRYLDVRLKHNLKLTEALPEHCVRGIHGGYDWACQKGSMFSPCHLRKFVFPRLKQITGMCHRFGVPYVRHTDSNINSLKDDLVAVGVNGFQAIEPRAGRDIRTLKEKYGKALTLIGNVDYSTVLVNRPVETVQAATEEVIKSAAPGVRPEFYLAMLETARAVGNYPIANHPLAGSNLAAQN